MQVGVFLSTAGPSANSEALRTNAQHAEQLGYHSVWVLDRLLFPLRPRNPYPATDDGRLPDYYKSVLDPLTALTYVAAHTTRIRLGTCILDIPFYNPVVLARTLTTIDIISGGRLQLGFGQGWSEDEFEAVGLPEKGRGLRADEFIDVLKTVWTTDPVEFHGKFFNIAPSIIGPKPVQKPHPPIYLAAFNPRTLKRVAERADGWIPVRVPFAVLEPMLAQMRQMAAAAGRDPATLKLELGAEPRITPKPLPADRPPFAGSIEQLKEDVARARALHADELIFQIDLGAPPAAQQKTMETLRALAG